MLSFLVQVLWAGLYHRRLSVIPFDASRDRPPADAQAVLLIGDKVVTQPPMGFDWQFDPAAMWYEMAGLPFVFGVWCTMNAATGVMPASFNSLCRRPRDCFDLAAA